MTLGDCFAFQTRNETFRPPEEEMSDRPFPTPVEIAVDPAHRRIVASAWEGIEFLSQYRPAHPGPKYRAALRICRDAIDGWQPATKARRAFVAAAREAHMLAVAPSRMVELPRRK
jgi:hypothetical protein